jgi:hypothetical protein
MSDSRCTVKIEFSVYGKTYKWDASINYSQGPGGEVDERISGWFEERYADAYHDWSADLRKEAADRMAHETERREREEFQRLRLKYGELPTEPRWKAEGA